MNVPIIQKLLFLWYRPQLFWRMWQIQQSPTFQPFLALLTGDTDLEVISLMSTTLMENSAYDPMVEQLQQDPVCAAMIADRYMAPPHDLTALLNYPATSLGHVYATQMLAKGMRAEDLYEDFPIDSDASYVEARLSQTHDIWHIVTGFDTSLTDEIGLQAFHLPQFPYPLAVALLSSTMMSTMLNDPEQLPTLLDNIQKGWAMGKLVKPLFAQKWEEAWDKPLAQWQSELGITPLVKV